VGNLQLSVVRCKARQFFEFVEKINSHRRIDVFLLEEQATGQFKGRPRQASRGAASGTSEQCYAQGGPQFLGARPGICKAQRAGFYQFAMAGGRNMPSSVKRKKLSAPAMPKAWQRHKKFQKSLFATS